MPKPFEEQLSVQNSYTTSTKRFHEEISRRSVLCSRQMSSPPSEKSIEPSWKEFRPRRLVNAAWKNAPLPLRFLMLLWVFVPAAIVLAYAKRDEHRWIFAISYISMIPCASTLDFTGQELARKLPRVSGILLETVLSTVVEMVLFIVLIARPPGSGNTVTVIKAAILGSILANMLLCLGFCLLIGGMKYEQQQFHSLIGGTSSDVLLGNGFILLLPAVFFAALYSSATSSQSNYTLTQLSSDTLAFSRGTAVVLMVTFFVYMYHNISNRRTLLDRILASEEESESAERLTLIECIIVGSISLGFVCLIAFILVREVHPIVHSGSISENFMGLIIVPLVEKLAEHITVVSKVRKNQPNMAIFHCVAPSIQTALFNTPLVVFIGWGLGVPMDLNFEVFQLVSLLLSIMVVINFLGDGSSNYLKGYILIVIYINIAVGSWYYPSITISSQNEGQG